MTSSSQQNPVKSSRSYVLMTAAHNEEAFIEKTLASVLSQTALPKCWVIVSDNSGDRTDEIVERYADRHAFIRFVRVSRPPGRSFSAKVAALQKATSILDGICSEFIGNLDADVSLEPAYFENLMSHFDRTPLLGIAAGFIHEERSGRFHCRSANRVDSVPHAAQLMRRSCYRDIGGYSILKYGGEDWHAQTSARMKGWQARAIPELRVFHHRATGAGASLLHSHFRLGRLDYSFGSDAIFEFFKCARRFSERPLLLGGLSRFSGFIWSYMRREPRPVSEEFITFLRSEQKAKVVAALHKVRIFHTFRPLFNEVQE